MFPLDENEEHSHNSTVPCSLPVRMKNMTVAGLFHVPWPEAAGVVEVELLSGARLPLNLGMRDYSTVLQPPSGHHPHNLLMTAPHLDWQMNVNNLVSSLYSNSRQVLSCLVAETKTVKFLYTWYVHLHILDVFSINHSTTKPNTVGNVVLMYTAC